MMKGKTEMLDGLNENRVWVSIEILKATSSVCMKGSMLESDFNKIIAGNFENKFIEMKDIHWTTPVKINNKNGFKFVSYGKDGEWRWHTGEYYIIVDRIISISILKDMSNIINSEVEVIFESNL
jgi:hypothetical protein